MSIAHSTERVASSASGSGSKVHRVTPEFSIADTRRIVNDLFQARPAVYWTDFLVSMGIGAACFTVLLRGQLAGRVASWLQIESAAFEYSFYAGLFVIMCLAFYRATLFTHELVHLRENAVPGFRRAWNLLCGVPFLMPSFLYQTHVHHHMRKHYATKEDGEYLALSSSVWAILGYLAQSFVIPIVAVVRFLILTPAKWLHPSIARWVNARASSMVVDPAYVRPLPTDKEMRLWQRQEFTCFAYCLTMTVLLTTGVLPIKWLFLGYSTAVSIITLNAIRTLGAHRYQFDRQHEVTFVEQLLDSVNYPRWPLLSELWAPVGLRYHALHHLFPSMPYHSLPEAHRRLMTQLPADSPYRRTESPGLCASLRQLWRNARSSTSQNRTAGVRP